MDELYKRLRSSSLEAEALLHTRQTRGQAGKKPTMTDPGSIPPTRLFVLSSTDHITEGGRALSEFKNTETMIFHCHAASNHP